jgi:hypothetical protein
MTPSDQIRTYLVAMSRAGARMWRMNVGLAWTGSKTRKIDRPGRYVLDLPAGALILYDARPFKAGVKGMSDTAGFSPLKITPEMVGQTVPVFTVVEVKQGSGRADKDQAAFIQMVRDAGGRAGVARTEDEAVRIVTGAG